MEAEVRRWFRKRLAVGSERVGLSLKTKEEDRRVKQELEQQVQDDY